MGWSGRAGRGLRSSHHHLQERNIVKGTLSITHQQVSIVCPPGLWSRPGCLPELGPHRALPA